LAVASEASREQEVEKNSAMKTNITHASDLVELVTITFSNPFRIQYLTSILREKYCLKNKKRPSGKLRQAALSSK
jgi:hypothetical protein